MNARGPGDFLAWEHSNPLSLPHEVKPTFVQMHDVELVKVFPGGLGRLIADEVDLGLLLGVGKGRFDTTSDLRRP